MDILLFEIGNHKILLSHIINALVIIILTRLFTYVIGVWLYRRVKKRMLARSSAYAFIQITRYLAWTICIVLVFQAMGVNMTVLMAGSAALLVGIGFGLQQTFGDFISGIILLIDRSIKIDDVLEFEDMVCKVVSIGVRTSTVVTRDDINVILPNSKFTSEKVINWTHSDRLSRFNVQIGVHYKSDPDLVVKCLMECAQNHEKVLKTPEPEVRLEGFDDSAITFGLYFWSNEIFRVEKTRSDLRFAALKAFRKYGIEIPYPQRDLYIKTMPSA